MSVTTGIALDYSNVFPNHPCGTIHVVDRNYMTCYAVSEISPRSCRHRHVRACASDTARARFRLNWTLRGLGDQSAELQTEAHMTCYAVFAVLMCCAFITATQFRFKEVRIYFIKGLPEVAMP